MALTTEQLVTLKTDILADPTLSVLASQNAYGPIATAYNTQATPDFTVWRTAVSVDTIMNNGFVWTAVDALTVGKARIWEWMTQIGVINPSKTNIRQGLADAFGTSTAMANAITPHLKRLATRCEKLFATGIGSVASPATMSFEGIVPDGDIEIALRS